MKYKTGNNNYDLCSAIKRAELVNNNTIICSNESKSRSYTITADKKAKIHVGLTNNNINLNNVSWIGEARTKLIDGTLLQYGYSAFINKD